MPIWTTAALRIVFRLVKAKAKYEKKLDCPILLEQLENTINESLSKLKDAPTILVKSFSDVNCIKEQNPEGVVQDMVVVDEQNTWGIPANTPPFVRKLYFTIMESTIDANVTAIISWEDESNFVIHDFEGFSTMMNKYFKNGRWMSQFTCLGIHSEFVNWHLQKGRPDLLKQLKYSRRIENPQAQQENEPTSLSETKRPTTV
ncbi:hypothetical protein ACFX2J_032949 [Malus domestica]